jgi:hypothetical protein
MSTQDAERYAAELRQILGAEVTIADVMAFEQDMRERGTSRTLRDLTADFGEAGYCEFCPGTDTVGCCVCGRKPAA